jgi:hypothetical protein
VLPESLNEVYTKGTWFKAGFLHTFTFLAMAFLLVNPPLGDIVAPQLADKWVLVQDDNGELNFSEMKGASSSLTWEVDSSTGLSGDIWLLFGLADNLNVEGANVSIELTNNAGNDLQKTNDLNFWDTHAESIENNTTSSKSISKLIPHGDLDQRFALLLGTNLAVGEHQITVNIIEQGDPWENTRKYVWNLLVVEKLPEAEAS